MVSGVAEFAEGFFAIFAFVLQLLLNALNIKEFWQVLLGVVEGHEVALGVVEEVLVIPLPATPTALATL